ncbi:MAG: polyprenyl synthetase family protein [Chitinophagaceae bacterium]
MQSFQELSEQFQQYFSVEHFPATTPSLYDPNRYFLQMGGKRIRPVAVLMGNELFDQINPDAWNVATAIELFHNFTLIHDDIMDEAPLRRGMETVHQKYGNNTALLAGDVMQVQAYDYLNRISTDYLQRINNIFVITARQVCEGQQLDMDFEKMDTVALDDYLEMITMKTSVLLAASLKIGGVLGGASKGNTDHLYEFGKNLGIAFQVQDDYLDAFGDPAKFGKQVGGDILANKKTFLLIHALEVATEIQKQELKQLIKENPLDKVDRVLTIFKDCKVDFWANELKEKYYIDAMQHLDEIAVMSNRKVQLKELAQFLIQREH